jgi:TnpA family transposase
MTTKTGAYGIRDFCDYHRISKSHFYNLLKKYLGPRLMQVGKRKLISEEAAVDWRRAMEKNSI